MKLTVVTPEKEILKNVEVSELLVPGKNGELGILHGHVPMVSSLGSGLLKYKRTDEDKDIVEELAVSWGFLEVQADSSIIVLAESGLTGRELNRAEAEKKLSEIEKKLEDLTLSPEEIRKLRQEQKQQQTFLQLKGV